MSDLSTRLALPFIAPAQAQKHVTHNEALERLDLLVQMRVTAFEATTPPEAPAPGALYALGEGAEGAWAGQDGRLAAFTGDSWVFLDPQAGWLAVAADGAALRIYRDGTWQTGPDRLDRLGLGAEADAANRLTVAGPATLLSHGGAGHRLKVNKAGAGETASVLFQSGFTGHAEMGLAGQNDFSIKVSPDGSSWAEALRFNALTGFLGGEAVQSGPEDTTPGRALLNEAHGLGSFTGGVLSQP
ncbi:DUF2793 domain-containing protein, partial [Roseovarius sp. SYSU LYC5161]|uniref:DUF2793 domain-containing protein n=1 Tax=Roseovarius halophilus (ex Wu et al. 2025) TaxID=3376060 RepID=UPI0039994D36